MDKLKEKLLVEYSVQLEVEYINTEAAPNVILKFKNEHSVKIKHALDNYGITFIKTKAETLAKMENWVYPFDCIENILIMDTDPYRINIQAISPLIFAFVLIILSN